MSRVVWLLVLCAGCYVDGGLTKHNNEPNLTFTAPDDGDRVRARAPVTFSANVKDAQQDNSELDYFWSVSPSGTLDASGMVVTENTVSLDVREGFEAGTWTVNLKVVDQDGAFAEDHVDFTAVEYVDPTVEFLLPTESSLMANGQTVSVSAQFVDPDQNDLSRLQLTWGGLALGEPSAPAHPDADGLVNFTLPSPSIGNQIVSVEVTDDDGGQGSGSVEFTVVDGDMDRDGYIDQTYGGDDCNDNNENIHPDLADPCDGLDNDCDGLTDEEPPSWYLDQDGDGFGDDTRLLESCEAPEGYASVGGDCKDQNPAVHPGAEEWCNGTDDDCDGVVDNDAVDGTWSWADADADGYGDASKPDISCSVPSGYVTDSSDCNDSTATVHPNLAERCNGYDDDCDGLTDDASSIDPSIWYADADGDSFGDLIAAISACNAPPGYITDFSDCDDSRATSFPGATETCDGVDDDCDGAVDENDAIDAPYWYLDSDSDSYGDAATSTRSCNAPSAYVGDSSDCDDSRSGIHPGATEYCNGYDDNCDGHIDESSAADALTWYTDADNDGYGNVGSIVMGCSRPAGAVADDSDCDDGDASVHPSADEYCNSIDEDCDGTVDEDAVDASIWYADVDGDTYGDPDSSARACNQLAGTVADDSDCNDQKSSINPKATETCNSLDDDCDGLTDDADASLDLATAITWYLDSDSDLYGDISHSHAACTAPSGYVADNTDCDDTSSKAHPGLKEVCNDGLDNDCDGTASGCTWSGSSSVSASSAQIYGSTASDLLADMVAYGTDSDGDGYYDVVVGSSAADTNGTNSGAIYVFHDPANGVYGSNTASVIITGAAGDGIGDVEMGGGDLNGDHVDDLLVGNPASVTVGTSNGEMVALFGPLTSGTLATLSGARFTGTTKGLLLGTSVAAGDVNGDGADDVLAGAPGASNGHYGSIYLFSGPLSAVTTAATSALATITAAKPYTRLGTKTISQDFDGDGYSDIISSAPYDGRTSTYGGYVFMFLGPVYGARTDSQADGYVYGNGYFGDSLMGGGDVNTDGYDDILAGQSGYKTNSGAVWLVNGAASCPKSAIATAATASYIPSKTTQYWRSPTVGFLDANAAEDLVIGAYGDDTASTDAGAAYIFFDFATNSGAYTEANAGAYFTGRYPGDKAGSVVAANGDADGDGQDDLLMSAPYEDSGGTSSGSVYLLRGPNL